MRKNHYFTHPDLFDMQVEVEEETRKLLTVNDHTIQERSSRHTVLSSPSPTSLKSSRIRVTSLSLRWLDQRGAQTQSLRVGTWLGFPLTFLKVSFRNTNTTGWHPPASFQNQWHCQDACSERHSAPLFLPRCCELQWLIREADEESSGLLWQPPQERCPLELDRRMLVILQRVQGYSALWSAAHPQLRPIWGDHRRSWLQQRQTTNLIFAVSLSHDAIRTPLSAPWHFYCMISKSSTFQRQTSAMRIAYCGRCHSKVDLMKITW